MQSPDRSIIDKIPNRFSSPNRSNLLKQINYLHIMKETSENRITVHLVLPSSLVILLFFDKILYYTIMFIINLCLCFLCSNYLTPFSFTTVITHRLNSLSNGIGSRQ